MLDDTKPYYVRYLIEPTTEWADPTVRVEYYKYINTARDVYEHMVDRGHISVNAIAVAWGVTCSEYTNGFWIKGEDDEVL